LLSLAPGAGLSYRREFNGVDRQIIPKSTIGPKGLSLAVANHAGGHLMRNRGLAVAVAIVAALIELSVSVS
jgi:hypothetical protein